MWKKLIGSLAFVAIAIAALGGAVLAGEKRFALLIGNQAYGTSVGLLKNPHNDIALIGEALSIAIYRALSVFDRSTHDASV